VAISVAACPGSDGGRADFRNIDVFGEIMFGNICPDTVYYPGFIPMHP
jgi:hypothetical protein